MSTSPMQIFNFINDLSPIKPVKSTHLNSLNFASVPCIFTSPRLKESISLRRHNFPELSKPEISCDDTEAELVRVAASYVEAFESGGFNGEFEQGREETDFDWDSLTFDSSDLSFDSDFRGFIQELLDSGTSVPSCSNSCISTLDGQEALDGSLAINSLDREVNSVENGSQASAYVIREELNQTNPKNKRQKLKHDGETEGCKRCNCKKSKCLKLHNFPELSKPEISCDDTEAELVRVAASYVEAFESGGFNCEFEQGREETDFDWDSLTFDSSDLSFDSDFRGFIQELLDSGTSVPSCSNSCISTLDGQEALDGSLAINSLDREVNSVENGSQASAYVICEELNQTNPKNKRQKLKHDGETEGCKRCNCKKSKCLKLYCECFAAGIYCEGQCSCLECFNKPVHKDKVFATRKEIELRNPLAFAPKVVRSSNPVPDTPVSAQHRRGCNCKKSSCIKKYCECYQGGVGCSVNCRCEGCKNTFGRKNGTAPVGTDVESRR